MACKYIYKGITYNSKEEFINKVINSDFLQSQQPKTRRILEVQSDLFQKGRDRKDLVKKITGSEDVYESNNEFFVNGINYYSDSLDGETITYFKGDDVEITYEEFRKAELESKKEIKGDINQNQFLQLLNKDSNWVTFFVKSIIQDSAKKGYEKVLFPTGNTASKVEGHTTLEEFKKQKEDRIKVLEEKGVKNIPFKDIIEFTQGSRIYKKVNNEWTLTIDNQKIPLISEDYTYNPKEDYYNSGVRELQQLKQELENVEGPQGFGALKPIYNFYENTVTNILKKQGLNLNVTTDEYGNTWNEVAVTPDLLSEILLQKDEVNKIIGQANIKAMTVLIDVVNQKQDTLPHEYAHHYIAWNRDSPIVQEAVSKWGSEEALVQAIGEQAVIQKGEAWSWWKKFVDWLLGDLNKLSKLDKERLKNILTDAFLTRQDLNIKEKETTLPKLDTSSSSDVKNIKTTELPKSETQTMREKLVEMFNSGEYSAIFEEAFVHRVKQIQRAGDEELKKLHEIICG